MVIWIMVTYSDWLNELVSSGELTEEERSAVVGFGRTKAQDSEQVSEYVKKFTKYYKSQGIHGSPQRRRHDEQEEVCRRWPAAAFCV